MRGFAMVVLAAAALLGYVELVATAAAYGAAAGLGAAFGVGALVLMVGAAS